ncbi:hypothetical protein WA026_002923 [Henosepilachna vigintioctopunctata]|uniref:Uncharacterized protein n=1 Tax=Henosepilachna vigintioctopunctata TaxID=420089 RepID=A0AAW1TPW0_9CUCU
MGDDFSIVNSTQNMSYIILSMILPLLLAHVSSGVECEGKKLIRICLACSNKLSIIPKTYEDELLSKCLSVLCHQAEIRMPQISASGFFNIDYKMLGMIMGTVTSTMVILLQFMQSDRKVICEHLR